MNIESMPSVKKMRRILSRGIAYHHAGLLPVLKEIVEDLFEQRIIPVSYTHLPTVLPPALERIARLCP